jgi:hypothetical protein
MRVRPLWESKVLKQSQAHKHSQMQKKSQKEEEQVGTTLDMKLNV